MTSNYGLEPVHYQPAMPAPYQSYGGGGGSVERYRPRTPAETVDDAYDAVVQATTLNTITHMAYDSVRTIVEHKNKLLADNPQAEPELNALGFTHLHGLMAIQRGVTDSVRRSKG